MPLLVDEAHGAHLGLPGSFAPGAVAAGADLVVQSLHKTLPSPTQTALLHWNSDLVSARAVEHGLDIFETSSPSYPLMAAMDHCLPLVGSRQHRTDGPLGGDLLRAIFCAG